MNKCSKSKLSLFAARQPGLSCSELFYLEVQSKSYLFSLLIRLDQVFSRFELFS